MGRRPAMGPGKRMALHVLGWLNACQAQRGGSQVNKTDQLFGMFTRLVSGRCQVFVLFRKVNNHRNPHSRITRVSFMTWHPRSVVAKKNNDSIVGKPRLLKLFDLLANPLIHLGNVIVILGQVLTHFGSVPASIGSAEPLEDRSLPGAVGCESCFRGFPVWLITEKKGFLDSFPLPTRLPNGAFLFTLSQTLPGFGWL